MTRGPRIGVALSSGGGRGVYAHTGFLLALEALGVEASAIAGCSAGAVVGGVLASDTDLHDWSRVIAASRPNDFWTPDSWPRLVWELTVRRGRGYAGLSGTEGAIEFCRRNLAVQTFEACRIPFYALAMQLSRGEKVLFCRGELAPRIVASAAMPVLYRPVEIDGDLYCDGAVFELTPTEAICCRHELDVLLVHHTSARRDRPEDLARAVEQPWAFVELLNRLLYCHRPWYLSRPPQVAVGYLRRSTDRQEQSNPDQRKAIERYAAEHGLELARFFVEDAIGGTSATRRPGVQDMVGQVNSDVPLTPNEKEDPAGKGQILSWKVVAGAS